MDTILLPNIKVPPYLEEHDRWMSFKQFHNANQHIYTTIIDTIELGKSIGIKKISVKHIISHLRWDRALQTKSDTFKINDAFTGIYTHLIIYNHPKYKGLLTTKPLNSIKKIHLHAQKVG